MGVPGTVYLTLTFFCWPWLLRAQALRFSGLPRRFTPRSDGGGRRFTVHGLGFTGTEGCVFGLKFLAIFSPSVLK